MSGTPDVRAVFHDAMIDEAGAAAAQLVDADITAEARPLAGSDTPPDG
jgi:hypothetical protein